MDTNFSREASSFTLMERGFGGYCRRAILASCMALAMFAGPSLAWAGDSHDKKHSSRHHLIDRQRIQDLRERLADLREQLKEQKRHRYNASSTTSGTTAGSLESLQAKVTSLESTVAALLSADTTLLTTLQAAQTQIATLQAKIATMESSPTTGSGGIPDLEKYVSINPDAMNGVKGPHIIFKGVNVHIQSGSGNTVDMTSGLGNLFLGYNETESAVQRGTGAHNLVVGPYHSYTSYGGVVLGIRNAIRGQHVAVLGGTLNTAHGANSSILGGGQNTTGQFNSLFGLNSTVYGGQLNVSLQNYSFTPDQSGGACVGC